MEILTAGRAVPVLTSGSGPGVVLVHGGGVGLVDYRRPIARLAERFTVHAYSRYAEPPGEYDLDADVELLRRVVEETGARGVIGHSIGGNVVLQALLRGLPVERAVLYDAAVCVEGAGFPTWFVEPMAEAVRAGDMPLAIALVGKGLGNGGVRLPIPIGKVVGALFLRTSIGRRMAERLPTVVGEARAAIADDGPASRFAPITAEVLMAYGASGPAYFGSTARAVAEALPHGRALAIPRARHDALNRGGERFLAPIAEFLAG